MVNIYLDVDGVLLSAGKPAEFLDEFIVYLDQDYKGSIYWLTTHCSGSIDGVMAYMASAGVGGKTLDIMAEFKPTSWPMVKAQAIDFTKPFIWFDDNLLYSEKRLLNERGVLDNHIMVDLEKQPDSLLRFIQDFPIAITK